MLARRIRAGEKFDIVVLADEAMRQLEADGCLKPRQPRRVCRFGDCGRREIRRKASRPRPTKPRQGSQFWRRNRFATPPAPSGTHVHRAAGEMGHRSARCRCGSSRLRPACRVGHPGGARRSRTRLSAIERVSGCARHRYRRNLASRDSIRDPVFMRGVRAGIQRSRGAWFHQLSDFRRRRMRPNDVMAWNRYDDGHYRRDAWDPSRALTKHREDVFMSKPADRAIPEDPGLARLVCRSIQAALQGAGRRGGRALPCVRSGRRISLRAGAQIHALRCVEAAALRAARPSGLRPQCGGAGDLSRRRQPRDGRRARSFRRQGARGRHRQAQRQRRRA